jgi:hypothetical protein
MVAFEKLFSYTPTKALILLTLQLWKWSTPPPPNQSNNLKHDGLS